MSINLITSYSDHGLATTQSEFPTIKREQFDEQDYCKCSSKQAALDKERISMFKKQTQDQADEMKVLREQFVSMQMTLRQHTILIQQQASEMANLKSELDELRSLKTIKESSSPNPFISLSKDELLKKLDIAEQKDRFFKEKRSASGELSDEKWRLLEYVAVNAISILSPGIILQESVSDILKGNPRNHLERLFAAQQFGQCHEPTCINFIKKGGNSSNLFLSFLYNTIKYRKEFRKLQNDLSREHPNEKEISQELMSVICKYGLDMMLTSVINPNDFNSPDVSGAYKFNQQRSKKLYNACGNSAKNYDESFSLWPFNEFVPVIVDPEGFPGHYLTSLFINHFSDPYKITKRMEIDDQDDVELELKQLKEALKSKR